MPYLDASVLFSLYCSDCNSAIAARLVASAGEPLVVSSLCEFETQNAFSLAVFRKDLTGQEAQQVRKKLQTNIDAGAFVMQSMPDGAFPRAKSLAQALTPVIGVRAADLLHIAVAIELGATILYTFDLKQHRAAQAAGLAVNPLP